MPFDIPDSWEWIRLSDIASFGGGKTPSMNVKNYWDNGRNLWVTSKDMKRYRIDDSIMKISDEALSIMNQYEPGTILIVTRSGILRHSLPVAILDKKATVNQDLKTISLFLKELNPYIFLTIKANESFILKEYHKDGTTVDSINFEKFSNILLPLPPVREQLHICSVVEGLFRLIDDLEASKQNLQDVIKQTKSKVLDLAIHGKLVPQDPTDEPASELLKRINPDAKPCDTSHYENLPKGWSILTVGQVAQYINGRAFKPNEWEQKGLPIIRIQNLNDKSAVFNYSTATFEDKYLVTKGDLLFAWAASLGTYIWQEGNGWLNQHIYRVIPKPFITKGFLYYSFESMISEFYKESHGSGMVHITKGKFENTPILLPPLQEQERIVSYINAIYALLDSMRVYQNSDAPSFRTML